MKYAAVVSVYPHANTPRVYPRSVVVPAAHLALDDDRVLA
jgi:hypothetical protein